MAAGSLLTLLDDIASVLDDVAVLTKLSAKKTAGVLGDDLALNAQQVSGVTADRELPVVWAVAKGSLRNKAILVPAALAISAFAPWAVTPLLMLGGAFLCFEGFEKLVQRWLPHDEPPTAAAPTSSADEAGVLSLEKDKIAGAVRTDFILSAEIIAITLGTVADAPFTTQLLVIAGIALVMTVGVYGLVAGIVKLDDAGLFLNQRVGDTRWAAAHRAVGRAILRAAPWLMKTLSVAGTAAMFLVGGGILTHGIPAVHYAIEQAAAASAAMVGDGVAAAVAAALLPALLNALAGIVAGAVVVAAVLLVKRVKRLHGASSGVRQIQSPR